MKSLPDDIHKQEPAPTTEDEHRGLVRSAGAMGLMTLLSRFAGLLRDILQAALLGTGMGADAFRVAFVIPNTLRRLLGEGSMTAAFVPTMADIEKKQGEEELQRFIGTFIGTFAVILLIVAGLGVIFSPMLVSLFTQAEYADVPGKLELTIQLNRIVFPYIAFISIAAALMAVLNARGSFAPSAFTPVLFNLSLIVCGAALASAFIDPSYGFAIGVLIGGLLQIVFQLPFLKKHGIHLRLRFDLFDKKIRRVFRLMVPGLFAVGVTQINIMIATRILTGLQQGAPSAMYYANRLTELTLGVFTVSIATVILPAMSRKAASEDIEGLKKNLAFGIRQIVFITVPATAGIVLLREPIVSILFQRGAFDSTSLALTTEPLLYLSIGMLMFSLIRVLAPAFYALKRMKLPVLVSVVDVIVNITLAYWLSSFMGIAGVAIAVSTGATVNVILLILLFVRQYGALDAVNILKGALRTVVASAVMGLVVLLMLNWTGLGLLKPGLYKIGVTLATVCTGAAVFLISSKLLKSPELHEIFEMIKRRKTPV